MDAVIDKDLSSALLAREIHADILVITTGVEKVSIHFGKPNQHALDTVDVLTMARYMQEGHFPPWGVCYRRFLPVWSSRNVEVKE